MNYLDNWYFPNAINQRKFTEGEVKRGGKPIYTIDRWMLLYGKAVYKKGTGLWVNGCIGQYIDTDVNVELPLYASALLKDKLTHAAYLHEKRRFDVCVRGKFLIAAKLETSEECTLATEKDGKAVLADPPPDLVDVLKRCKRFFRVYPMDRELEELECRGGSDEEIAEFYQKSVITLDANL